MSQDKCEVFIPSSAWSQSSHFSFCNLRQQKHNRKEKKKRAELNNHGTWPDNSVPQKLVSKQQKMITYQRGCPADPLSSSCEDNDLPIKSAHPGTCGLIYRCVYLMAYTAAHGLIQ